VLIQLVAFEVVRKQPWFVPPVVDKNHSNSRNSENTALFTESCYQYILSSVVLSIGRPFRQPIGTNLPFVVTLVVALMISTYMLLGPAKWLFDFMELTQMDLDFKMFLIILAGVGFVVSYSSEKLFLPRLAKWIGQIKVKVSPKSRKMRKQYKIIAEGMAVQ